MRATYQLTDNGLYSDDRFRSKDDSDGVSTKLSHDQFVFSGNVNHKGTTLRRVFRQEPRFVVMAFMPRGTPHFCALLNTIRRRTNLKRHAYEKLTCKHETFATESPGRVMKNQNTKEIANS